MSICMCFLGVFLSGCGQIKKVTGIHRTPPDEFRANLAVKKLEIPPDFDDVPSKQTEESGPRERKSSLPGGQQCFVEKPGAPLSSGEESFLKKVS